MLVFSTQNMEREWVKLLGVDMILTGIHKESTRGLGKTTGSAK